MIKRHRDIQLIDQDRKTYLAIACDVSAAIGPKVNDVVQVSGEIAGYYAASVPIIEVLAIGAKPLSVVDTIGVEMKGVGKTVIKGITQAMTEAGIDGECLTGSTEDNMPTSSTTIGVTIISELEKNLLEVYKPKSGHKVYVVGLPKMGPRFLEEEIRAHKGEVMTIPSAISIRQLASVKHMLPVGSKGISHELVVLMETYGLQLEEEIGHGLDLLASAGPATCMIVTCEGQGFKALEKVISQPIHYIGQLK